METFGLLGFVFAMAAMGSATTALAKISKLEKQLKEAGFLKEANKSREE